MTTRPTDAAAPEAGHAGVIALPPLIYLAALIVGLVAHAIDPRPLFSSRAGLWPGAALVVGAIALAIWARMTMERAGTPVNPYQPTTRIVSHGPFRFSRNPMYVALTLAYAGIALMVNGLWPALMTVPLLWLVQWGVVAREERYLDARFGDSYRDYRRRVRRWL